LSATANAQSRVLICRAGERLFGVPLHHVLEIMRPLPIEPLADAPPFVCGLSIIRGSPVPVVDAAAVLGGGRLSTHGRFVALRVGERCVALAVDEVSDVRPIPAETLQGLPPLLKDASRELVSRIGTLDGELLIVLEAARILPAAVSPAPVSSAEEFCEAAP